MDSITQQAERDVAEWIVENPTGGECRLIEEFCGRDAAEDAAYASTVAPAAYAHQVRCFAMDAANIRAGTCDANLHRAAELSGGAFTFDHARVYRAALDDVAQAEEAAEVTDADRDPFSNRNHGRLL